MTLGSVSRIHDPTRLVRVVNKIDGYGSLCHATCYDPIQLVWMVKEIEGLGMARLAGVFGSQGFRS